MTPTSSEHSSSFTEQRATKQVSLSCAVRLTSLQLCPDSASKPSPFPHLCRPFPRLTWNISLATARLLDFVVQLRRRDIRRFAQISFTFSSHLVLNSSQSTFASLCLFSLFTFTMTKQNTSTPEEAFQATYERIRDEVISSVPVDLPEVRNWLADMIEYNLPHGKRNRGLYLAHCYRLLKPDATEHQMEQARILGWCVEILQAFFLVHDDMMDGSITRRGLPCWFRKVRSRSVLALSLPFIHRLS
jgi:hypothetical protein